MKIAMITPYSLFCAHCRISEDDRIDNFMRERAMSFRAYVPCDSFLQLAAFTPEKHEIVYMDDQYGNVDTNQPFDLAALSFTTYSADRCYEIADELRQNGIYVVMGGIHTTLCPDEVAKHADTVFVGDADKTWPTFLVDFENNTAKHRYDGGCADITKRPPPRLSIAPQSSYFRKLFQKEVYSIFTSIGCPRSCKFCSNWKKPGYGHLQKKPLAQIQRELEHIASYSDDYCLGLLDDNAFLDVNHASEVVKILKDMNIIWFGLSDISIAEHPSLLKQMRESGCRFLCLGLESIREDNLRWLAPWKATQVKNYRRGIETIWEAGINPLGSFMVGMEHDTKDTFQEIFDFFLESKLISNAIAVLTPYPGTQFREKLIAENRLDLTAPWGAYSGYNLLYDHQTLSKKEMYDGLLWFLQQSESPEVMERAKKLGIR